MSRVIIIENEELLVEVLNKGAEIRRIWHKKRERNVMWSGDPMYWNRTAPTLFPIVGKLKDNRYRHEGIDYELPQHGFLRDQTFVTNTLKQNEITLHFESSDQFASIYPFEFTVFVTYRLEKDKVTVQWKVVNDNDTSMHFSIGAHPAFSLPFQEGETLEDYELQLGLSEHTRQYEISEGYVIEKKSPDKLPILDVKSELFSNDALIFEGIDQIILQSKKDQNQRISVHFPKFPFVGIWSPYNIETGKIAPFICIEPWYGIADLADASGVLVEKKGIQTLQGRKVFETSFEMQFE